MEIYSVKVFGMGFNRQDDLPVLLEICPSLCPSIHIQLELFPEDQLSDYRLHLLIQPIRFLYDTVSLKNNQSMSFLMIEIVELANDQSTCGIN